MLNNSTGHFIFWIYLISNAVSVGKRIETETAQVSVPVEKDRVVIERKSPAEETPVATNNVDFQEGEIARVELGRSKK